MHEDVPEIAHSLGNAKKQGIIVMASASNVGANYPITFPARLKNTVFCVGSADGKGSPSVFNPPFMGEEKFSALGEAVKGARFIQENADYPSDEVLSVRRDGTSTAVPVAAGIAAFLIDYVQQFMDRGKGDENYENIRKLFIKMSEATVEQSYRYLAPWYLFGAGKNPRELIKNVLSKPAGMISSTTTCQLTVQFWIKDGVQKVCWVRAQVLAQFSSYKIINCD